MVSPDTTDHLDCLDSEDLKDHLGPKETWENPVWMDKSDPKVTGVKLDHPVCQELQVFMDDQESRDLRENPDSPDATEPKETVEQTVNEVWTDPLVPRVFAVKTDHVESLETVSTL